MALLNFDKSPHGGRIRLLPDNEHASPIEPRIFIAHSIVGSIEGAFQHFAHNTSLESTFGLRLDGFIEQWMDTEKRADANAKANSFANSVETEDNGDPDTQPWTNAQLNALVWLFNELNQLHPKIQRRAASHWDGSGVGYHTMFPEWVGTPRTCPGRIRINQFNNLLIPMILATEEQGNGGITMSEVVKGLNEWFGGKPIIDGQRTPGGTLLVAADHARKANRQGVLTYAVLESILAKLESIDQRLSAVELRIAALEQKGHDEAQS